jgi:NAD(P)-dependent dehydrogenase (short-subunit alcohol dehydrogenase family)
MIGMTPLLEGKVALVTGASRGIGAITARALADAGAAVVLAARDAEALAAVAGAIEQTGAQALAVPTDVSVDDDVRHAVDRAVEVFGRLDVAFNNAAGGPPPAPLHEIVLADFDAGMAINVRGLFSCLRHEIPAMLAGGGGAIVNMSSTAGVEAVSELTAYVTAKHAVIGMTKAAALDYAAQGVRVNAVAPGPILTHWLEQAGEDAQRMAATAIPLGRIGRPEEVAEAVVWLCSDQSSFITGATLPIEGGKLAGIDRRTAVPA